MRETCFADEGGRGGPFFFITIRNITGGTYRNGSTGSTTYSGAFKKDMSGVSWNASDNLNRPGFSFSANADENSYGNPIAGHANGSDIHPYNISLIPIIIVS